MAKKKNKLIIFSLIILGVILLFPGLIQSIVSIVSGEVASCEDSPFNPECICPGERKISVPWLGVPRWSCENIEQLIIDPESLTFEQDALNFVTEYLTLHCGDTCTDLSCGDICGRTVDGEFIPSATPIFPDDRCISAVFGFGSGGERVVNVECIVITERDSQNRPRSGTIPWRMSFFVESATGTPRTRSVSSNYCSDPEVTEICEPPLEVVSAPLSIFSEPQLGSGFS